MSHRWLGMVLVAGCGRIGFAPVPADGGPGSGAPDGDADATAAPRCARWSTWSTPQPVAELNDPSWHEYSATLTADDLVLCLSSWRGTISLDLWCATRADPAALFSSPVEQVALTTTVHESDPVLSPDGLELFFAADRGEGAGLKDMYRATRVSLADSFGAAQRIVELATTLDEEPNAMSRDGLLLYFNRAAIGFGTQLLVARRDGPGQPFYAEDALVALNSDVADEGFALSADGLEVVFGSSRPGAQGLDAYVARRTPGGMFDTPTRVPELSSAQDDLPGAMSSDGTTLYMNYDADFAGGSGQADLWSSTRTCLDGS